MLSMAIYLRPVDRNEPLLGGTDWNDLTRYGFEIGTVIGVLCYVIVQQGEEIKNQGFWSFCKQLVSDVHKCMYILMNSVLAVAAV
jgi:hypothetical protein